ncbi:MAG TPA: hypothetical protein VFT22_18885 [Kofleriaceae bacterium]|nr:hypothetical protein [Kofleriaceae bacterium]
MSIVSPAWRFKQLGGDQKELILAEQDAPHGRPRQKPIVTDAIEAREYTVYYDGNDEPTRHIFGNKFDDWELTGRFRDRAGGVDYARQKTEYCKGFQADNQPVSITCGNQISARGFIKRFAPGRESFGEVTWSMTVLIDADDFLPRSREKVDPSLPAPAFFMNQIGALLADLPKVPRVPDSLRGSLFDSLDSLVSTVNSALAIPLNISLQIQSFEQAFIGDIRRMRAGIGQLKTALVNFRTVYESLQADLALQSIRAEEMLRFSELQSATATATARSLAILADMDIAAAKAERGKIKGMYEAKTGDTWESASMRIYGSADRANDLRSANGVPSGSPPIVGAVYQVPK